MLYDINNNFWYFIYGVGSLLESEKFIEDIFTHQNEKNKYNGKITGNIKFKNVYFTPLKI